MKKKKKVKLVTYLDMGNFPGHTMFSVGLELDEVVSHLIKKGMDEWAVAADTVREKFKKTSWGAATVASLENRKTKEVRTYPIVVIRDFNFADEDYTDLAHEFIHICQFYLPDILDRNKEYEAEAYLHSHLMDQALKQMRALK